MGRNVWGGNSLVLGFSYGLRRGPRGDPNCPEKLEEEEGGGGGSRGAGDPPPMVVGHSNTTLGPQNHTWGRPIHSPGEGSPQTSPNHDVLNAS